MRRRPGRRRRRARRARRGPAPSALRLRRPRFPVLRQRPSAAELFVSAHLSQKTDVQLVSHSILPSFIFVLLFFCEKKTCMLWRQNARQNSQPSKARKMTSKDTQAKRNLFFCCVATRFVVLSGQVSACSQEQKPFESF